MNLLIVVGLAVVVFAVADTTRSKLKHVNVPHQTRIKLIALTLLFLAGWDSAVYFYVNWNLLAVLPVGFYVLAGIYLALGKVKELER